MPIWPSSRGSTLADVRSRRLSANARHQLNRSMSRFIASGAEKYVRENRVLKLVDAVRKMPGLPAEIRERVERGLLLERLLGGCGSIRSGDGEG